MIYKEVGCRVYSDTLVIRRLRRRIMEIHNPYDQECLVTVLIIRRGVIIETP